MDPLGPGLLRYRVNRLAVKRAEIHGCQLRDRLPQRSQGNGVFDASQRKMR